MREERTEHLRAACRNILQPLLADAEAQLAVVGRLLAPIEREADDFMALYNVLEIASGQFPFSPYHNYYFEDLRQPTESLLVGAYDGLSERYFEMPAEHIKELHAKWVTPVHEAVLVTFDKAKALYVRVASEAAIVRRLSGYKDLLDQLGQTLKTPWADGFAQHQRGYTRGFPIWVNTMKLNRFIGI
jgi:hypothetical protein